jgi:hypothetical protein
MRNRESAQHDLLSVTMDDLPMSPFRPQGDRTTAPKGHRRSRDGTGTPIVRATHVHWEFRVAQALLQDDADAILELYRIDEDFRRSINARVESDGHPTMPVLRFGRSCRPPLCDVS